MATRTVLYVVQGRDELSPDLVKIKANATAASASLRQVGADVARLGGAQLKGIGDQLSQLSGGLFRVIAGFTFAGLAIDKLLSGTKEWDLATATLGHTFTGLRRSIAEAIGPTLASMLTDVSIGFAAIGTWVVEGMIPAVARLGEAFRSVFDLVASGLKIWVSLLSGDLRAALGGVQEQWSQLSRTAANLAALPAEAKALLQAGGVAGRAAGFDAWQFSRSASPSSSTPIPVTVTQTATTLGGPLAPSRESGPGRGIQADVTAAFELPEVRKALADTFGGKALTGAASVVSSGASFSSIGALAGPVGAAIGALADNADQLPKLLAGLDDRIVELIKSLPKLLLVDLPMALITDFIPGLIKGIGQAIADAIKGLFGGGKKPGSQTRYEELVGRGLSPAQARQLSDPLANIPRFDRFAREPGQITRTGLAVVHAGEVIGPRRGGGGMTVSISIDGARDPAATAREVARELRRLQGSYGVGLTLDPLVS